MDRHKSDHDREHVCSRNRHLRCAIRVRWPHAPNAKAFTNRVPFAVRVDPQPLEEALTALGGIPLVVQAFRSLGLPGSVQQHVTG